CATPPELARVYGTVLADLSVRVGELAVARDGLAAALLAATQGDTAQLIFLRADTNVPYGEVLATLDGLGGAGLLMVAVVGRELG
ncbi:biopolymer transporter ExbD, partial [Stenotrophomonas maltophilia]